MTSRISPARVSRKTNSHRSMPRRRGAERWISARGDRLNCPCIVHDLRASHPRARGYNIPSASRRLGSCCRARRTRGRSIARCQPWPHPRVRAQNFPLRRSACRSPAASARADTMQDALGLGEVTSELTRFRALEDSTQDCRPAVAAFDAAFRARAARSISRTDSLRKRQGSHRPGGG